MRLSFYLPVVLVLFLMIVGFMLGCAVRHGLPSDSLHSNAESLSEAADKKASLPRAPASWFTRFPDPKERENILLDAAADQKEPTISPALPGWNIRLNQDPTCHEQFEVSIDANPNDPLHLVAAWIDLYSLNWGQGYTFGYGWSFDGGLTWESSRWSNPECVDTASQCDPAVAFDTLGNVFITFMDSCGCAVARSTDGGLTFGTPVPVACSDKPYVSTNPLNNEVYLVDAMHHPEYGSYTVHFSKSTDSGSSFTDPIPISNAESHGNGALIRVGTGGEIYCVWSVLGRDSNDRVWFDRSSDGGASWMENDVEVATGIVGPPWDLGSFRNPNIVSMAVDWSYGPHRGRVYVVFADSRYGDPDIMLVRSDDHGDTWSEPLRVNDDSIGNGAHQWFPWIAVDDNGHVHVTFLDRRNDPNNDLFSLYLATSTDGGASVGPNIRVSDGFYGPGTYGFLGDYTNNVAAGGKLIPVWPDARYGDNDIFTHRIDLADYDEDGVPNDGNDDGQYSNAPCTGGQSNNCDDNCPGVPNPDQGDADGDGVGDVCDNCPDHANPDRSDMDRDGWGDACDPCVGIIGADDSDPDSDGVSNCTDNCPDHSNDTQVDNDADGIGDICDPCLGDSINDADSDGLCAFEDNCPEMFNPEQLDADGDGVGNPCDRCPGADDSAGTDTDGDGWLDACDCQPEDSGDRPPPAASSLRSFKENSTAYFSIGRTPFTDLFSVVRGTLSSLRSNGDYGSCLQEGIEDTGFSDADIPPAGDAYFYLVQGHNLDCGLGPLGFASSGAERVATSQCIGVEFTEVFADSENTQMGSRIGDYTMTHASDDVYEQLTEGRQATYVSLDHSWTFQVPVGSKIWLHHESHRTDNTANEAFFYYATADAADSHWAGQVYDTADPNGDYSYALSTSINGSVEVEINDQLPFEAAPLQDTVSVDHLWIRVVQ